MKCPGAFHLYGRATPSSMNNDKRAVLLEPSETARRLGVEVVHSPDAKAVVLLFGWLGAQDKHLKKYSDLYTTAPAEGGGGRATVVRAIATSADIMLGRDGALLTLGLASLRAAVDATVPPLPMCAPWEGRVRVVSVAGFDRAASSQNCNARHHPHPTSSIPDIHLF